MFFYQHEHTTSFKFASFCINLHAEVIPLCPRLLILYALHLCMIPCYVLVTMAACESFARLVSWQRCTCRGKLLRAQCVLETQSLRGINNWVGLEPCTSWGLACWMGQILLWEVLLCKNTKKKMLCFSWRWPCCQLWSIRRLISSPAVISGSSEAITATETSIKLQGEGFEGFSCFAWGFYSSALPLNILLKPKHKIRAGWDECVL